MVHALTRSRILWHAAARALGLQQIPLAVLQATSLLGGGQPNRGCAACCCLLTWEVVLCADSKEAIHDARNGFASCSSHF